MRLVPRSLVAREGTCGSIDLVHLDGAFSLYLPVLRLLEPHLRPSFTVHTLRPPSGTNDAASDPRMGPPPVRSTVTATLFGTPSALFRVFPDSVRQPCPPASQSDQFASASSKWA